MCARANVGRKVCLFIYLLFFCEFTVNMNNLEMKTKTTTEGENPKKYLNFFVRKHKTMAKER